MELLLKSEEAGQQHSDEQHDAQVEVAHVSRGVDGPCDETQDASYFQHDGEQVSEQLEKHALPGVAVDFGEGVAAELQALGVEQVLVVGHAQVLLEIRALCHEAVLVGVEVRVLELRVGQFGLYFGLAELLHAHLQRFLVPCHGLDGCQCH